MDLARARSLANQLVEALADTPPAPSDRAIDTVDDLDRALSLATPGTVLTLDRTLVYPKPLTIRANGVTLRPAGELPLERMVEDLPLPRFTDGLTFAGDGSSGVGVEVRRASAAVDIVVIRGARVSLDRVRVLGHPLAGGKRGIAAHGNGDVVVTRCHVDHCFGPYPGDDTQAIFAADMAPGLVIDNNYLSGGSETLMLGGMDASSAERMPRDVGIRGNTITKRREWQTQAVGVKNLVEFKACRDVLFADNDCSLSWGGHGQTGYLLMLTVRNQSGGAPWSTIANLDIVSNRWRAGAAAINILGRDNLKPSGVMSNVRIRSNEFLELDPIRWTGSKQMILISGGPDALTIDSNDFVGSGMTSVVYLDGKTPCTQLALTNNRWPKTTYGLFGNNVGAAASNFTETNPAWQRYVASGTIARNLEMSSS